MRIYIYTYVYIHTWYVYMYMCIYMYMYMYTHEPLQPPPLPQQPPWQPPWPEQPCTLSLSPVYACVCLYKIWCSKSIVSSRGSSSPEESCFHRHRYVKCHTSYVTRHYVVYFIERTSYGRVPNNRVCELNGHLAPAAAEAGDLTC